MAFFGSVEDGFAVGELKIVIGKGFEGAVDGIINGDLNEGVGDILAVGADVLNGGGTGVAGDFTEGFDAGKTAFAGVGDDVVPRFAAHDSEGGFAVGAFFGDAAHTVDDNDAHEAFVVADCVGATTEDEGREMVSGGEAVSMG